MKQYLYCHRKTLHFRCYNWLIFRLALRCCLILLPDRVPISILTFYKKFLSFKTNRYENFFLS